MAVVRLDGGLFFATADALEDRVRGLVHAGPDVRCVVVDWEGINFLDSQGSAAGRIEVTELVQPESGYAGTHDGPPPAVPHGVLVGRNEVHDEVSRGYRLRVPQPRPPPRAAIRQAHPRAVPGREPGRVPLHLLTGGGALIGTPVDVPVLR